MDRTTLEQKKSITSGMLVAILYFEFLTNFARAAHIFIFLKPSDKQDHQVDSFSAQASARHHPIFLLQRLLWSI